MVGPDLAPGKSCCLGTLMWTTSSAAQVLLEQKKGLEEADERHLDTKQKQVVGTQGGGRSKDQGLMIVFVPWAARASQLLGDSYISRM